MPRHELKELDILLFNKKGTTDLMGNAIEWFQWGLDCKSPEFVHAALITRVTSGLIIFETNPPKARYTRLEKIDLSKCTLLSRTLAISEENLKKSRQWCKAKRGEPYGYQSIFKFAMLGLYGRLGPYFRKQSREELRKYTPVFNEVCSQLVDDLFYDILKIDILPDIGIGNALPGDMVSSTIHKKIETVQK